MSEALRASIIELHRLAKIGHGSDWKRVDLQAQVALGLLDQEDSERRQLREALAPFASFAEHAVEATGEGHYGWMSRIGHERICDWFGPTDFGEALAARGPQVSTPVEELLTEEDFEVLREDNDPGPYREWSDDPGPKEER